MIKNMKGSRNVSNSGSVYSYTQPHIHSHNYFRIKQINTSQLGFVTYFFHHIIIVQELKNSQLRDSLATCHSANNMAFQKQFKLCHLFYTCKLQWTKVDGINKIHRHCI